MAMAVARPESLAAPVAVESTLIEECRTGDPRAFARLVSIHERLVYSLAARLLGDPEEARDVSQEVFLQVFRTLAQFEGRSSLKTWIYRIAVNQCHNRRRWWQRRRRDRMVSLEVMAPSEEPQVSACRAPDREYERGEQSRLLQQALRAIPFRQRAVLLLREVEGLSCEETAEALGLPVGTVKSRLSRARMALKHELGKTA